MNETVRFLLGLLVMAGVTYLIRMLPMVLVKKKITNTFVRSFLYYIPYAVLAVMTVPAIFMSTKYSLISGIAGFTVALVLSYFKKGLLPVAASACATVLAVELILKAIPT
ncbi:MAG: AzlD domain-containing protein [Clostridia bacterium]|nr:AzlD domain-containing protein [Clostridia bacterium]